MSHFGKVAVLMGGTSSERQISLMSGKAVLDALVESGVRAHSFDPSERDIWALKQEGFTHAFIMLHGRGGEDGVTQAALELMKIPYTGSKVAASALAMDKWRTKMIWDANDIPTPPYGVVDHATDWDDVVEQLGLPFMLKAAHEGSSVGIVKVTSENVARIDELFAEVALFDGTVLAEAFVSGTELTCAIVDDEALPLIRIVAPNGKYDFQNKYFTDETKYFCPSEIDPEIEKKIKEDALTAFQLIGCSDWGRLDVMLRDDGSYSFLEVNTVPGMTAHSLVPMAAKQAGMSFEELCLKVLESANVG
jgi:D-alanine-D-alanine ligase